MTTFLRRYYVVLFAAMKWIATVHLAICGAIAIFVLSDMVGLTQFGYPPWAAMVLAGFVVLGLLFRKGAIAALNMMSR